MPQNDKKLICVDQFMLNSGCTLSVLIIKILFIHLFLFLFIHSFIYLFIYLFINLFSLKYVLKGLQTCMQSFEKYVYRFLI